MSGARQIIAAPANAAKAPVAAPKPKAVDREAGIPDQFIQALMPSGGATSGQPLDPHISNYFSQRFGHSLSDVRIERNNHAVAGLGARAMTLGQHIAFAPGQYQPDRPSGLQLIGHEIVHSLQQDRNVQAPIGGRNGAAEREAGQLSTMAMRGERANVSVSTEIGPAFALSDYMGTTVVDSAIASLTVSQLRSDINEITEYLDRQMESSMETGHLEETRGRLQARLRTLIRGAHTNPPRRRRGRRRRAAPPATTGATAVMPRILSEQESVPPNDYAEVQREVDRIVIWLQRPDVSADDREILRMALYNLSPQFEESLATESSNRRTERLQVAFGSGSEGAGALRAQIQVVESIYDDPSEPRAAFMLHNGERLRISREQATTLRNGASQEIQHAVQSASGTARAALGSYRAQQGVNDDFPVVSAISGWLGGVDDPAVALSIAHALVRTASQQARAAIEAGQLSNAIDPLLMASTQARRMSMAAYAYREGLISGAETAVTGLTFIRDASAAIGIAIAAVVAAPFVAGVVGVGGLGLTGAGATALTIGGTGLVVGGGAAGTFGGAEYIGQRVAGESHDDALEAAGGVAQQRFVEGAAAGLGGATTRVVSAAMSGGTTITTSLGTRLVSQGAGNFVGGTGGALLGGADLDDALLHGGRSAAVGSVGVFAGGSFASNPALQTGVEMITDTGVNYLDMRAQGATQEEAFRAGAINLATSGVMHSSPRFQQQQNRYQQRGQRVGASVRSGAARGRRYVGNQVRAAGLGLALSAPPALGFGASGSHPAASLRRPAVTAPLNPSLSTQNATASSNPTAAPAQSSTTATTASSTAATQAVAPNAEATLGMSTAHRTAARGFFSDRLNAGTNAVLGAVWNRVANAGESATLTIANSRRLFDNQRNRFWRAVRRDPAAVQRIRDMGGIFPEERNGGAINPSATTIPEINLPNGTRLRVSIDHATERQTDPTLALDPGNLRFSTIRENTVVLRQLHDQDPFNNPPGDWIPWL